MKPILAEEKTKIHYSSYYVFSIILIVFLGYHFLISPTFHRFLVIKTSNNRLDKLKYKRTCL